MIFPDTDRDWSAYRRQLDERVAQIWHGAGDNLPAVVRRAMPTAVFPDLRRTGQRFISAGETAVSNQRSTLTGYKIVTLQRAWHGGSIRFFSTHDRTEYVVGKRLYQEAQPNHGGGYYVFRGTADEVAERFYSGNLVNRFPEAAYGLLLCEVETPFYAYGWNGEMLTGQIDLHQIKKAAVSGITPIEFLGRI